MRAFAHFISVLLLLPSLVVATALVALDHVSSKAGFLAFLLSLLEIAAVLLPWLLLCLAFVIALASFGMSVRYRWAAAICVAAIAIGSTGIVFWLGERPAATIDAFHLPAAIAIVIAVWLAVTEWPESPPQQLVTPTIDSTPEV